MIEGNLKKQIFKIKQQLLKEKMKNQAEANEKKKSGTFTIKEEDNESDEIKTEVYLTSDMSDSSSADESQDEKKPRKGSRRISNHSNAVPKQKGGVRLNINVGALTIETAEKFKKLD